MCGLYCSSAGTFCKLIFDLQSGKELELLLQTHSQAAAQWHQLCAPIKCILHGSVYVRNLQATDQQSHHANSCSGCNSATEKHRASCYAATERQYGMATCVHFDIWAHKHWLFALMKKIHSLFSSCALKHCLPNLQGSTLWRT